MEKFCLLLQVETLERRYVFAARNQEEREVWAQSMMVTRDGAPSDSKMVLNDKGLQLYLRGEVRKDGKEEAPPSLSLSLQEAPLRKGGAFSLSLSLSLCLP